MKPNSMTTTNISKYEYDLILEKISYKKLEAVPVLERDVL